MLRKIISTALCWAVLVAQLHAAALTPAVNAPMLSMAGGTAGSTIWSPTSSVTSASLSDTSCFSATGQGPGQTITPTTSPVAPYVGNNFLMQCAGVLTAPGVSIVGLVIKVKWGSVTVATVTTSAPTASGTNLQWTLYAWCTINTISATANSSTVTCMGAFTYSAAATGSPVVTNSFQSTSPVSVDTTAAFKLDLTLAWASTVTTQTWTSLIGLMQILF